MPGGQTEATRQSDFITPIMADSSGNVAGAALAVTNVAAFVDLNSIPGLPSTFPSSAALALNNSVLGHFVDLAVDSGGNDVYVVFGPTQASVTGANVPAPATTTTVNGSGVITVGKGICMPIPTGTTKSVKLPGSLKDANASASCRFMGFITKTGTATLRVYRSDGVNE